MKIKDLFSYCGLLIAALMYVFIVFDVIVNPMNPDFAISAKVLVPLMLFMAIALMAGVYIYRKIKYKKLLLLFGFCILAFFQAVTINQLAVRYDVESWDMSVVFNAAQYYVTNGTFDMGKYDYFLWFPNNSPLYNIFIFLFRIFAALGITNVQLALNIFNAGLLLASAWFIEKTVQVAVGQEYTGVGVMMCVVLCPFSLYAVLAYTDTFSMIFLSAALYFYVCTVKGKGNRFINLVMFSLLVAFGASMKVSVLVLAIAALIDIVMKSENIRQTVISFALVAAITFGGFTGFKYAHEHSPFLPEYDYNLTIPYTHWVMMGLNGLGGYCDDDYQLITLKQPDVASRQNANIEEIKNRIASKGPVGMIYHIINKLSYIYSDGTFTACYKLDRSAVSVSPLHDYVIYLGSKFYYLGYFSLALFMSMLAMISAGIFKSIIKRDTSALMPAISLVGVTIFLLLWEARARYILNFLPLFILMTVFGIKQLFYHDKNQ